MPRGHEKGIFRATHTRTVLSWSVPHAEIHIVKHRCDFQTHQR